jgi:hypothetical protein
MKKHFSNLKFIPLLITLSILSACGGGESNDSAPSQQTNLPPTADAGSDISAIEGDSVELSGNGTDSDGSISIYSWEQTSGPNITIPNNDSANISFTAPEVDSTAIINLRLTVTDNDGASGSDDVEVTIDKLVIETIEQALDKLESTGGLPILDVNTSLSGNDDDNNGIRDDIDNYIANEAIESTKKDSLKEVAKSLQTIISSDLSNTENLEQTNSELTLSIVCLSSQFSNPADAHRYLKKIEAYTANTRDRAEKYNSYNSKLDGTVTRLPDSADCQ